MSTHILTEQKACNTCGVLKTLENFHRNKNCPDGRLSRCKACRKIADATYVDEHRGIIRSRARKWRADNTSAADQRAREWALKNPNKIKAIRDRFRKTEHGIITGRVDVRNRRARLRNAEGKHSVQDIQEIMVLQRCKCANCAASLKLGYHIDHRVPISRGGRNDRNNLELLCPTCNVKKSAKLPHVFAQENGRLL